MNEQAVETFQCTECKKSFRTKNGCTNHYSKLHATKETTHRCSECQKPFPNREGLRKHRTFIHKDKTHACDICQKCFSNPGYLNAHKRNTKHTQKRNTAKVSCEICQSTFASNSSLQYHQQKFHGFDKPGRRKKKPKEISGKKIKMKLSFLQIKGCLNEKIFS